MAFPWSAFEGGSGNRKPLARRLTAMRKLALIVAAVFLGSCVSSAGTGDGGQSKMIGELIVLDGTQYELTCAEPTDAQLGPPTEFDSTDARFDGRAEIVGEDPTTVQALRSDGRLERCPSAEWVLAFHGPLVVDAPSASAYARLRCEVPGVPDNPLCKEGGPFWYGTDPSVDGTEGDGRSAVWIDGSMPDPEWRLDPLEVVAREVGSALSSSDRLDRVGLRVVEERPDEMLVEVLYQEISDATGKGTQQREQHTIRRLAGRIGWYPVEFIVVQYYSLAEPVDPADLDSDWSAGLDRILVDVDRR